MNNLDFAAVAAYPRFLISFELNKAITKETAKKKTNPIDFRFTDRCCWRSYNWIDSFAFKRSTTERIHNVINEYKHTNCHLQFLFYYYTQRTLLYLLLFEYMGIWVSLYILFFIVWFKWTWLHFKLWAVKTLLRSCCIPSLWLLLSDFYVNISLRSEVALSRF